LGRFCCKFWIFEQSYEQKTSLNAVIVAGCGCVVGPGVGDGGTTASTCCGL